MADPSLHLALDSVLEVAVYVDDLDAAEVFCGGVLGLQRIARLDGRHVFFRCGGTIVLVFRTEETRKPAPTVGIPVPVHGSTGAGHICFAVDGHLINDWRSRLEKADVDIEADFRWPNGARSVYFRDPGGNSVELAEPHLWSA